jgi:hypothetical protein
MRRRRRLALVVSAIVGALLLVGGLGACAPCSFLPIPGGAPEIELWADEEVLPPGGCTVLHWQVSTGEQYPVFLNGREVAPEGEEEVCLEGPTTYELVVGVPGGSVSQTLMIRVEGEPEGPPPEEPGPGEPPEEPGPEGGPEVINLIVDPDVVPAGGCAVLHWEVMPPEFAVFLNGQEVPPVGEREECPEGTVTYELIVEAPGGPQQRTVTLQVEGGGPPPEPTPQPPAPPAATATQPAPPQPTATQPPPPQPSATPTTFVPVWGQCSWVKVEQGGINSHQPVTWCSNGSFLTGMDLDRGAAGIDPMDSPVVGAAQCCPLSAAQFSPWGQCSWVKYGNQGAESHQAKPLCPNGQYLTGLDLDRYGGADPLDSPVVGQGFCCPFGDPNKYTTWASCSWVKVEQGGINSHQPVTWCPNGSFMAGLDLDRGAAGIDPLDSPVVGQAYCCFPKQ